MAKLTDDQRFFLKTQKLPLSQIFDASGMRKAAYAEAMKAAGANFAFGTTPCARGGHTLRTRAGHCIQCDTSKIAYQMRHHRAGFVYLAGSPSTAQLKIGSTGDLSDRESKLRDYAYGGAADWEIILSSFVQNAGRSSSPRRTSSAIALSSATMLALAGDSNATNYSGLHMSTYDEARAAVASSLPGGAKLFVGKEARARHLWP